MPKLKDPNAPNTAATTTVAPTIDWGAQVEAFGQKLKESIAAADDYVSRLYVPNSSALTRDPDTGQFWDGIYPENLSRLEPTTLSKYLQMSVSEMMRFHRLVVDITADVENATERIDFMKDALGGTVPGGNAEQRKTNTTTNPQLIKEKLARVYYKRILERAKFGYKYHAEHRELLDSLLNNRSREKFRSNALGETQNYGYVSPFTRQYQQGPQQLGAPNAQTPTGPQQPSR